MDEFQAGFELRPLSIGEILDRTFALYRRHFWLYAGMSAVAAAVATLGTFVQMSFGSVGQRGNALGGGRAFLGATLLSFAVGLVHLLAYSVVQAATVAAVEANYLGQETSVGPAFEKIRAKWYRYILITFWQGWSFVWPLLVLVIPVAVVAGFAGAAKTNNPVFIALLVAVLLLPALVAGFILYLRNSLGIVACVSEKLTVRQSMKRSKFLVADRKMGMFLLYLLVLVLALVAGSITGVLSVLFATSHGGSRAVAEVLALSVTFLTNVLVQPVSAIAFGLFYLDQRVRKEGFDVEQLLAGVTGVRVPGVRVPGAGFAEESVWSSPALGNERPFE